MNSRPEPRALAALQAAFAADLRASAMPGGHAAVTEFAAAIVDDGLPGAARLRVYRNNARAVFEDALQRTYPVVRRRVGDEFFAQLAAEYRVVQPSRHGDLHWVGQEFPAWLVTRLAGTGYEWLADLARLEWACEESLVAADAQPVALTALGDVPPELLAATSLELRPSLRCVASDSAIWSVWQENQPAAAGRPVDLASGAEHVIVACGDDGLVLHLVPAAEHGLIACLAAGDPLGDALESSGLTVDELPHTLAWLFAAGFVVGVQPPASGSRS